ncbi:MAG: response regulator [Proteobacteria bacterium]|nr:response regulator [Pseudomonadota bacterium]
MLAVECGRAVHGHRVLARFDAIDLDRCHALQAVACLVSGAIAAMAAPLFLGSLEPPRQALLTCVLCSLPAIGTIVAAGSRLYVLVYSAGVFVPVVIAWSTRYPGLATAAAASGATYVIVLYLATVESSRMLARSFAIRQERDRMVKDLERSNQAIHAAVAQARREASARARVLAAASHDLRQPLHALSLYSAVLSSQPSEEAQREAGMRIDQLVHILGDLLHGLLDLSRISSGEYIVVRERFDLRAVVESICAEVEPSARSKGLDFDAHLETAWIDSDQTAISRILRNLLDNALKYTASGRIGVRLARVGSTAEIAVIDTGPGIPEQMQGRVFEEFFQIANHGRDRAKGVGLGLTIVKRLVEQIGGSLSLDSTTGAGCTFCIRLACLTEVPADTPRSAASAGDIAFGAGRRVVVLDDDEEIARAMVALLSLWGYAVEAVTDAQQVGPLFARGVPDLLIADLRLGGEQSGLDVVNALVTSHGDFPVLFVTGEASAPPTLWISARGVKACEKPVMCKPLDQAALRDAIVRLVGA